MTRRTGFPRARLLAALLGGAFAAAASTVTFHGGAGCVGGSCATVERDGYRMLVDCGTAYGDAADRPQTNAACGFPFDPRRYGDLLLTHAHQDHAGRVPELFHSGFTGTVWTTEASRKLLEVSWRSYVVYDMCTVRNWRWTRQGKKAGTRVHWREACEWSRKIAPGNLGLFTGTFGELQKNLGLTPLASSYAVACRTCQDLELQEMMGRVKGVAFGEPLRRGPFTVTFAPVKHLPGAAAIRVADAEGACVFSGDLGSRRSRLVTAIEPVPKADALFIESTYGDAALGTPEETAREYARFREVVGRTVRAGGVAWIPAFALDRSQRVLLEVKRGMDEGTIPPETPIHYLSPSSRAFMQLYVDNPGWFDVPDMASVGPLFKRMRKTFSPRAKRKEGAILVTTSGMMDTGFSLKYVPDLVPEASTAVCLVGYQSPGTCGAQLKAFAGKARAKEAFVRVKDGKGERRIPVRASVHVFTCFSGHGDARENEAWLANNRDSAIYLVHGDAAALKSRAEGLRTRFGGADVEVVQPGKPYRIVAKKKE